MGLQHPEEADVDAARCRGYLLGKAATERLAALDVKDARAAGYKAGALAGLKHAYGFALMFPNDNTRTTATRLEYAIAQVERTGELPEEAKG